MCPHLCRVKPWDAHTCNAVTHMCLFSFLLFALLLVVRLLFVYIFNDTNGNGEKYTENWIKASSGVRMWLVRVDFIIRIEHEFECKISITKWNARLSSCVDRSVPCVWSYLSLMYATAFPHRFIFTVSLYIYCIFLLSAYAIVTYKNLVVWDVLPKGSHVDCINGNRHQNYLITLSVWQTHDAGPIKRKCEEEAQE